MTYPVFLFSSDNFQAGKDRVQVHTQYRTIIPGWWLRTGLICCWQATLAVCQHKDAGTLPNKNCHQHQRVCCFSCCRMEQLTPGTTNVVLLSTNFCTKTKETPVYQLLRVHLRIFYYALYKCSLHCHYYVPVTVVIHTTVYITMSLCTVAVWSVIDADRERCVQEMRRNGVTPPNELSSSKLGPISPNRYESTVYA